LAPLLIAALSPFLKDLFASGLNTLGGAVLAKGKDYVEKELGVKFPDENKPIPPEMLANLRDLEFKHEEALQSMAIRRLELELEGEKAAAGAVTERWKADMLSDSWLSKNIRPLVLIYLLGAYSVLSLLSAFSVNVTQAYVELLAQALMLVLGAYFAGRTAEKIVDMRERGKL
jgi:hypothetical protein